LRFAQNSRSNALDELPIQSHRKSTLADRRGVNVALIEPRRKLSTSRRLRNLSRQQSVSSNEASWFLTLPEKIRNKQFTREEQVVLAGRLRESVILDAADEAIYKASRRASRNLTPLFDPPTLSTPRSSTDSYLDPDSKGDSTTAMAAEIYESFRWMDEEDDLDLKLVLDDYHANLDGVVIPTPASNRRPSFRRQLSISKRPFGRNSFSSLRSPKFEPTANNHNRQKSRALSLIAPKHGVNASVSSIDPNATHYQDPEARLKLRVYLASPQKFDAAIEFGFPAINGVADGDKENKTPKRASKDCARMKKSFSTEKSFLNDDDASLFEDDVSMNDPESPITPICAELGFRPQARALTPPVTIGSKTSADFQHLGIHKPTLVKQPESYAQAMAGNREMTLRMTLTRPDLRADESALYGWQAVKSPLRETSLTIDDDDKYAVKGPLGGVDGWGPMEKEDGVVKRFWNKVKSSQRKTS
jgi:hypothetical protein